MRQLLAIGAMLAGSVLQATPADADAQEIHASEMHWSQVLRSQMQRTAEVDWRLATLATPLCSARAAGFGITTDSLGSYAPEDRPAVAQALGLSEGAGIAVVADGSPAADAGLREGDILTAINGAPLDDLIGREDDLVVAVATDRYLASLDPDLEYAFTIDRQGVSKVARIQPVLRCAARTVLEVREKVDAYSDRDNLAITTGLAFFTHNDDELALVIGHELAHVILREEFEAQGIGGRKKEDRADWLGAELTACAGYDLALANQLWTRFDSTRALSFLPTFSHRKSKVRYRNLEELRTRIDCDALGALRL